MNSPRLRSVRHFALWLVSMCWMPATARSQAKDTGSVVDRITRALSENGYANVAVTVDDARVVARFENARFRDDRRALAVADTLIRAELRGPAELVLEPSLHGILMFSVHIPAYAITGSASNDRTETAQVRGSRRAGVARATENDLTNRSFGQVELILHPWVEASFGDYENPVASRVGIAPELFTVLKPGLALSGQFLVTLQNDLHERESALRPGVVTVSQLIRVGPHAFVSGTAGTFTDNRYGLSFATRAISGDGRFSAGVELGRTGQASYARGNWQRTPLRDHTALVESSVYFPTYDLTVRATAGVFLKDDRGIRLDVVRRFGELHLGAFVVSGANGSNGGFHVRIPLAPARRGGPVPVRVRLADAFDFEYRYLNLFSGGRAYRAQQSLDEIERRSRLPGFLR